MGLKDKALKLALRGAEEFGKAAEKVQPAKEKVENTKLVVTEGAKIAKVIASEKAKEIKEANEKKPSTGSSILDAFLPTVPNTEATKPKAEKKKKNQQKPQP